MEIIEVIAYILILLTSWLVGKLLAWLCDDELVPDRKYFFWLSYLFLGIALIMFFAYFDVAMILSLVYMVFVFGVMLSENKNKIRKKRTSRVNKTKGH